MTRKLITVDETFLIQGRGLIVTGLKEENCAEIKGGEFVEITRPNETTIQSQIAGIEFIKRTNPIDFAEIRRFAFLLRDLSKEDVPKGSVINLLS